MKYNEIILNNNGEEVVLRFRLTSGCAMQLEEKTKKPVLSYLQEESMTMIVTMIRYMRMWEEPNIGMNKAQEIYDLLIDNEYTYKDIIQNVIYETLVSSGFLKKEEWELMKKQTQELTKKMEEELNKVIAK